MPEATRCSSPPCSPPMPSWAQPAGASIAAASAPSASAAWDRFLSWNTRGIYHRAPRAETAIGGPPSGSARQPAPRLHLAHASGRAQPLEVLAHAAPLHWLGEGDRVARIYWHSVEFGLALEDGELKILGAGLASSFGEAHFSLESGEVERIPFSVEKAVRTPYRHDTFQPRYLVSKSLDATVAEVRELAPEHLLAP